MRVQLSEKSKAEFIELITEDSITCWFEGDEFVMPSGQGKTAKGIVLGKLLVWQHQQSKVDELQKQKSLQELEINQIAQANQQWQLKCGELQKRVDASLIAFEKLKEEINELHGQCDLHLIKYLEEKSQVLEQALKGDK